ncbi:MFS transporter [Nocardia elegans]|uniref:MFS transporter n=1 Tax=Nocardia elegans TaxID=300029 RepID=UPI001894F1B7|nr:MFS transporter [Nocardia elegans]MBF6244333.1 MFS transporter [Nocardia elegans]
MPPVVFVLAVAVFAQGTSEFMVSGLLQRIADDVGVSLGAAGLLTSLFAAGMVVGAPVMAMTAGRLPVFGAGSFLGVTVTGRYSDRHRRRIVRAGTVLLVGVWVVAALVAHTLIGVTVMSVVAGAVAFGVGSTLIATIVQTATPTAPRIAGALATTAFNNGAVLGPVAAGSTVDHTGRPATALWCGAAFTAAALGVVLLERNRRVASRSSSDIADRSPSRRDR